MNRLTRESLALLALLAAGCAQQREAIAPRAPVAMRDSAVSVQAPFVNVRIGEPKSMRTADAGFDDNSDQYDDGELADIEE